MEKSLSTSSDALHEEGAIVSPTMIFVGDLPFFCTEEQLRDLFSRYGQVRSVEIVRNDTGQSLMHAFVDMMNSDDAKSAESALEGFKFMGRRLRVVVGGNNSRQYGRTERNDWAQVHLSFVSRRFEQIVTEEELEEILKPFGEVMDVSIKKHKLVDNDGKREQNGYGFAFFKTYDEAQNAVTGLKGYVFNSVTYDCQITHRSENIQRKQQHPKPSPRNSYSNISQPSIQPNLSQSSGSSVPSSPMSVGVLHIPGPGITPPVTYRPPGMYLTSPNPSATSPPFQYANQHYPNHSAYVQPSAHMPQDMHYHSAMMQPQMQPHSPHGHSAMMQPPSPQGPPPPTHHISPLLTYSPHIPHSHLPQHYTFGGYGSPPQPQTQIMYGDPNHFGSMPSNHSAANYPTQSQQPVVQTSSLPMPRAAPLSLPAPPPPMNAPRPRSHMSSARSARQRVQQQQDSNSSNYSARGYNNLRQHDQRHINQQRQQQQRNPNQQSYDGYGYDGYFYRDHDPPPSS